MTDLQDTIILTDELGNELTARIILTFESEEFNKSYVVYKLDDDDNDEYHAASFDPEDGDEGSLGQIETDAEWDLVEEVLENFLDEAEENEEK
ncbi:MAG: DUF1292 domain-containing protein [Candidatus Izemoplasmatales bacterium]